MSTRWSFTWDFLEWSVLGIKEVITDASYGCFPLNTWVCSELCSMNELPQLGRGRLMGGFSSGLPEAAVEEEIRAAIGDSSWMGEGAGLTWELESGCFELRTQ